MKQPLVAIIESSSAVASDIVSVLSAGNIRTVVFSSAVSAMEYLKTQDVPDVFLIDLHLSGIEGWRLCRLLRSEEFEKVRDARIILMSSILLADDLAHMAHGLSANGFINLSCEDSLLMRTVKNVLEGESKIILPSILLVEDDKRASGVIISGLKGLGYDPSLAATKSEAKTLFNKIKPDILVVDHLLPDGKGLDFVLDLRSRRQLDNVIVIVITAVPDPNLAIEYSKAGADAFIRKPFSVLYLADQISHAQRGRALIRVEELINIRTISLQKAEEQFRDLYENAPVGYHMIDLAGMITSMNATELGWLGYSAGEIVGKKTIFDLQTADSAVRGRALFEDLKASGRLVDVELELVRKNGTVIPVLIHSVAIKDHKGNAISFRTIVMDVSERKRLEDQLMHAQRMEYLGTLSVGIAHNFNNLLTPILMNASYLLSLQNSGSDEHEMLQDIVDTSNRAADLVRDLTALESRAKESGRGDVDLGDIVRATIAEIRKTNSRHVKIDVDIAVGRNIVKGVKEDLRNALKHLCLNALDAMSGGGSLSVRLSSQEFGEEDLKISAFAAIGRYLMLEVADTGVGISRELQKRIFDPFFTTKGLASGVGLGLSVVYGVARNHGGFVRVSSQEGKGSSFKLYFPAAR